MIHLPVAWKLVPVIAQDPELLALERDVELLEDLVGQVLLEGRRLVRIGCEDHAVSRGDSQLAGPMIGGIEVRRHSANLVHPALEGNALEVPFQIERPLVVGADKFLVLP